MSNITENYVNKANITPIINKIEGKLENRYTKDEVDDLLEEHSGGHTIENASGTALTQRDTLQFKGGLSVSDDSTNEVTVVSDEYEKITWEAWDAMTPQEKAQHPNVIVTGKPYTPPTPILPDGKTVTPTDDVQTLLACAGIDDKSYTTLNELLADTTTLQSVISSENAIDYLVRSTTWASGICANQTAMSYVGLNNYASNTLLADTDWLNAICDSTYFESVLNVKVPTMTSDTTPSGECFASASYNGGYEDKVYYAFDGYFTPPTPGVFWQGDPATENNYIGYDFISPKVVKTARIAQYVSNGVYYCTSCTIEGSNDNSNWTTLYTVTNSTLSDAKYVLNNSTSYRYYRLHNMRSSGSRPYYVIINEIQLYGREDV